MHQTDAMVYELNWAVIIIVMLLVVYSCTMLVPSYQHRRQWKCGQCQSQSCDQSMGGKVDVPVTTREQASLIPIHVDHNNAREMDVSMFFKKC